MGVADVWSKRGGMAGDPDRFRPIADLQSA